jgi:hypothetical protein
MPHNSAHYVQTPLPGKSVITTYLLVYVQNRFMKLQSAIEYLSTYGWAILILSIVGVVFFTFINVSSSSPQECILPAGFSCQNFFMTQNGLLTLNLLQTTSDPIGVTAIGCTNPQSFSYDLPVNQVTNPPATGLPVNILEMPIGSNYIFSNIQCYSNGTAFFGRIGSIFTGYVEINYTNSYTGIPGTIYGKISVKATS